MVHTKQISGMKSTHLKDKRKLYLSQKKYIKRVPKHFNMKNAKIVNTLLTGHMKLSKKNVSYNERGEREHAKVSYPSLLEI